MITMRNRMLYDNDVVDSVRDLIAKTSTLKTAIFTNILTGATINQSAATSYLLYINGYLKQWDDFAMDMKEKMSKANNVRNAPSIHYDVVKPYIYDSYDYNAMVSYAEALTIGIKDRKFKDKSDIDDFFAFTVSKAFGDHYNADTVAGILDSILLQNNHYDVEPNDDDRRMFNSIRNKNDIFKSSDRTTIYNNTKNVINFISDKKMISKLIEVGNTAAFVAAVNTILDFVAYTITMYVARIYMINMFAYPYINTSLTPVYESADEDFKVRNSEDVVGEITIMRDADDGECSDINKFKVFASVFTNACNNMMASCLSIKTNGDYSVDSSSLSKNIFAQKLFSNDLYAFICNRKYDYVGGYDNFDTYVVEINDILKSLITVTYNTNIHGTPKNEFISIIKGIECKDDINGLRSLMGDLSVIAIHVCNCLANKNSQLSRIALDSLNSKTISINTTNKANDNQKMIIQLYHELALLFIAKGREIEVKYNKLNIDRIQNMVGLNLGNLKLNDHGTTSPITNVAPDSIKTPINISDLYALPSFENFQFYDEMVAADYGYTDDLYYSEAFNFSGIINTLKSLLMGLVKKVQAWWNNEQRKKAMQWATKYGDQVIKMNFAGKEMDVLPFKNNGSKEHIDLSVSFDNIMNGCASLNNDTLKTTESVTNWIKSMYPAPEIYNWFAENEREAAAKFHSYVLFKDIAQASTKPEPTIKIKDGEINKRCSWWVDTCKQGQAIFNGLIEQNKSITKGIDQLQKIITELTKNSQQSGSSNSNTDSNLSSSSNMEKSEEKKDQNQNANKPAEDKKDESKNMLDNAQLASNELQKLLSRIYLPLTNICMEYIDEEYRCIRRAYSMGNNNAGTSNNQQQ